MLAYYMKGGWEGCGNLEAFILYMESWSLPYLRDFGDVCVLRTFSNIPAATAAGIARGSQLTAPCQDRRRSIYFMAGGTVRPSQYKSSPLHPLLQQGKGRAGRRVKSVI